MAESRFKPTSINPDTFTTGRPDGFNATWEGLYAYPAKAKDGKYYLNLALVLVPDEDSGFDRFMEPYSGGFLNQCVPSKDGITPAGGEDEDFIALSQGKYEGEGLDTPPLEGEFPNQMVLPDHDNVGTHFLGSLSKSRAAFQLLKALQELDEKKVITQLHSEEPSTSLSFANGYRFRFDRVPQKGDEKKKKKPGEEGKDDKEYKVLVPTTFLGKSEGGKKNGNHSSAAKSTSTTSTPESSSSANGSEGLEERIKSGIAEYLGAQKDKRQKRGVIATQVMKKFEKSERGQVYDFILNDDNLSRLAAMEDWTYDQETDERWLSLV